MITRHLLNLTLGAMALAVNAIGGPPLLTDDPDTPGPNHWEINLAITSEKSGDEWKFEAPLLDLNYGVGEHIQLKYEVPLVVVGGKNETVCGGLGNSTVGVKWRFLDEENAWLDVSTYPQFEFNHGRSSVNRGLAESGRSFLLPFEIAHKFGRLTAYSELGHFWNQKRPNEWLYGIAAEYEVSDKVSIMAEFHGTAEYRFRDDELVSNLGSRWKFNEHTSFLISMGRAVRSPGRGDLEFLGYVAVQFIF